jgi:hypothetical protein
VGRVCDEPRSGVDDFDKSASFLGGASPRRSTLSLDVPMPSTSNSSWEVVASFSDAASAHAMLVMFRGEGVPADVVGDTSLLGEARHCEVRVPSELAHRARWLMSQAQFTDTELTYLATGELEGSILRAIGPIGSGWRTSRSWGPTKASCTLQQ